MAAGVAPETILLWSDPRSATEAENYRCILRFLGASIVTGMLDKLYIRVIAGFTLLVATSSEYGPHLHRKPLSRDTYIHLLGIVSCNYTVE